MYADALNANYDSYDQLDALDLVNALRSYISVKLDHEKKTSEFITDLRQRLFLIHQYNCRVAKVTHQYPRSKKLELLLIKYVELEFDLLYDSNPHPPRDVEAAVELRVLRLLQVMLYPAVLSNKSVVNKNADRVVTKAVLQILGEIRSTYLVENKLVCNITNKLLKKIKGSEGKKLLSSENKNVVTSDYGSDDSDTDFDSNIFSNPLLQRPNNAPNSTERTSSPDCVEVLPTSNGLAPIPTFEFSDDDDIFYFIYLQRQKPTKRKLQENDQAVCETSNKNVDTQNVQSTNLNPNKEEVRSVPRCSDESKESCVIVCSDSEDEGTKTSNEKPETYNEKNKKSEQKKKTKSPVVTFEILDDDDDDENSYMVYLHKEVETNKKTKKPKERRIEEVIICSDSEDDSVEKANTCQESLDKEKRPSNGPEFAFNSGDEIASQRENTPNETTQSINLFSIDKNCSSENTNLTNIPNCDETLNSEIDTICHGMQVEPIASTSAQVDPVFFVCNQEISAAIQEDYNPNLLVDPAVILEQVINLKKDDQVIEKFNIPNSSQMDAVSTEIDILSPIADEKVDESEDLANASECRLNESLLEEILLDDNYKEFKELEYFLFNDSTEKQGFSLSNLSCDDNETVPQPETFHADIQSLEAYINNSNLIDVTGAHCAASVGASEITFGNNEFTDNDQLKLDITCRRMNPNRQVKNTTCTESWKSKRKHSRVKDLRTIFKQYKKVNKR